ncbi:hypothetical protein [Kribbella swartbergensis]
MCVARFTAETDSLLMQYVAGVVALGADFTVDEATPEAAGLIAEVGERLRRSVSCAAVSAGPASD